MKIQSVRFTGIASLTIGLLLSVTAGQARAAFENGDLYLITAQYPTINNAIVQIDAATGSHTVLANLTGFVRRTLTWDPFRNRLLGADSSLTAGLMAIDANGNVTFPAPALSTPQIVASRGTGIVYLWSAGASLRYLDAADASHDLLDIPGTGPYTVAVAPTAMIYDPGTNALFLFQGPPGNGSTLCPVLTATCVVKVPLTADGTQVAGVATFAQFDVSLSNFETPSGASYAPGGQLLVIVDTNSNAQEPRMLLLDPTTLALSPWASNGPYTGAAATNAGIYSSVLGQAVILDTGLNQLRAYSMGETGNGTTFGSGLSGTGSGDVAYMVEIIVASPAVPGLSVGGLLLLATGVGTIAGAALLRRADLPRR